MCKAINKAGDAVTTASLKIKPKSSVFGESINPDALAQVQRFELDASKKPAQIAEAAKQAPFFTHHLTNLDQLPEGQNIHVDGRVEPNNDEKMKVEWFKNGKPLTLGSRIITRFDFGFVSLDILGVRPDDAGIYTCRAFNELGEAISTCTIKVKGKSLGLIQKFSKFIVLIDQNL